MAGWRSPRSTRSLSANEMIRRLSVSVVLFAMASAIAWLTWQTVPSKSRSKDHLDAELQDILSELVTRDQSVKNCVVSVVKGDGSFAWSGAAGRIQGDVAMSKDTPIYIARITKLYKATVIMMLFERGAVALDDPMAKYLPHALIDRIHVYAGTDYSNNITVRELFAHRSGIAGYYTEKASGGKSLFDELVKNPERRWTVRETIDRARELRPKFPPGTDTSYSDTNFQLLGMIIEEATEKPLHVVFEEILFRPLRLDHTWLVGFSRSPLVTPADVFFSDTNITSIRSNGSYWADGGIVSTADEMNRFLKALKGGRLIRSNTLAMMHDWHQWEFPLQYGLGTMYFAMNGVFLPRRPRSTSSARHAARNRPAADLSTCELCAESIAEARNNEVGIATPIVRSV